METYRSITVSRLAYEPTQESPTPDNVPDADEFLESRDTHTHTYPTRDNVPDADEFLESRDTHTPHVPHS